MLRSIDFRAATAPLVLATAEGAAGEGCPDWAFTPCACQPIGEERGAQVRGTELRSKPCWARQVERQRALVQVFTWVGTFVQRTLHNISSSYSSLLESPLGRRAHHSQ